MTVIGKIEEIFELSGRAGLTVVPGIINKMLPRTINIGQSIVLVNPDGTRVTTAIVGIEMPKVSSPLGYTPIMLRSGVTRSQVQKGAVIELEDGET